MEMYRATARQRGKSFPSCAWRMPLLHREFSLAFARRFLDLTTFYDSGFWFIPQQVRFLSGSFYTSLAHFRNNQRHIEKRDPSLSKFE